MIDNLISKFSSLPGLGPKSAKRIVLHLLKNSENTKSLLQLMSDVIRSVHPCNLCGNLNQHSPCDICTDNSRNKSLICIVKDIGDLWALEHAKIYSGLYHVLGENLSSTNPSGLDKSIAILKNRIENSTISEIILATSPTVEGQITSHYICDTLKKYDLKISSLGCGIPIGGEIDYMDEGTLSAALTSRKKFDL